MPGKRGRMNGEGSNYQRASDNKWVGALMLAPLYAEVWTRKIKLLEQLGRMAEAGYAKRQRDAEH